MLLRPIQTIMGPSPGAYEYLDAQGSSGQYTSLHGFDAVAALATSKNTDLFLSFNGFYKKNEHVNGFTGGPLYKLSAIGRVTPLGFSEVGDSRTSLAGIVTNAFTFVLGGGILVELNQHVSLEFIPAEYVLTLPRGMWQTTSTHSLALPFRSVTRSDYPNPQICTSDSYVVLSQGGYCTMNSTCHRRS